MSPGRRPPDAARGQRARIAFAMALALVAVLGGASPTRSQATGSLRVERPGQGEVERVPTRVFEDQVYLQARDLARLIGASLHWRADVRKLVLRNLKHSLKLTVDSRWAVLDESEVFQLSAPVRQVAGEIYVPVSACQTILSGRFLPEARVTADRLVLMAEEPDTGPPVLAEDRGVTRLSLPSSHPLDAGLVSARASRFTLRVPGARLVFHRSGTVDFRYGTTSMRSPPPGVCPCADIRHTLG